MITGDRNSAAKQMIGNDHVVKNEGFSSTSGVLLVDFGFVFNLNSVQETGNVIQQIQKNGTDSCRVRLDGRTFLPPLNSLAVCWENNRSATKFRESFMKSELLILDFKTPNWLPIGFRAGESPLFENRPDVNSGDIQKKVPAKNNKKAAPNSSGFWNLMFRQTGPTRASHNAGLV